MIATQVVLIYTLFALMGMACAGSLIAGISAKH